MRLTIIFFCHLIKKRCSAEEARRAHNPKVGGSKPPAASDCFWQVYGLIRYIDIISNSGHHRGSRYIESGFRYVVHDWLRRQVHDAAPFPNVSSDYCGGDIAIDSFLHTDQLG